MENQLLLLFFFSPTLYLLTNVNIHTGWINQTIAPHMAAFSSMSCLTCSKNTTIKHKNVSCPFSHKYKKHLICTDQTSSRGKKVKILDGLKNKITL